MKVIPSAVRKAMVIDYDANLKNHLRVFDDSDETLINGRLHIKIHRPSYTDRKFDSNRTRR
jgi:hypothetical protein